MPSRWKSPPLGRAALAAALALTVSSPGCNNEKAAAPKACCDQPRIPPGVPPFTVVVDEVTGPTDGQDVKMRVAFKQKTKHDDVYPALHFLYRYAMTRNTFEPVNFVGEFYATEGGAQTGGNPLAKVWRDRDAKGPKCENAVVYEFPEEVQRAFDYSLNRAEPEDLADSCHLDEKKKVARVDDAFKHKPSFTVDPATFSATVTYPYLETGKDEYVKDLSFNGAMTYWAEFMTAMFAKSAALKKLTYVGVLDDQPVLKITTTREQFDKNLSRTQETIASYAAITFAKLGLHKTDDKGAKKDQEQQKTKIYKAALAYLPKDSAYVSPRLKADK
ncbi:MAG TPA: hypothetical protein VHL80_19155 [Polyangia bacterium]|nr:hypothetical protein [Polyangia bacterium]